MTFFKPNHKLFKISLTKIKTPNGDVFYFLFLLYPILSSSLYSSTETALTCFHVTNLLTPTNPNQSNSSPDHFLLSHWSKPSKSPLPESSSTTHFFFTKLSQINPNRSFYNNPHIKNRFSFVLFKSKSHNPKSKSKSKSTQWLQNLSLCYANPCSYYFSSSRSKRRRLRLCFPLLLLPQISILPTPKPSL